MSECSQPFGRAILGLHWMRRRGCGFTVACLKAKRRGYHRSSHGVAVSRLRFQESFLRKGFERMGALEMDGRAHDSAIIACRSGTPNSARLMPSSTWPRYLPWRSLEYGVLAMMAKSRITILRTEKLKR